MPYPNVAVPAFPNVPNAPGVPQVLRSALATANRVTGALTGVLDVGTGAFTGRLQGILTQATGRVTPILATARGVLDAANNVSATLTSFTGVFGASVVGTLTGSIDRLTGVISATLDSLTTGTSGSGLAASVNLGASRLASAVAEPFVWGLYRNGSAVLTGDNVIAVEYQKDFRILTYPTEGGGFQSYNKVETPYSFRVTFTKGGTEAERAAFLEACERIVASLDLYDVATPEKTYVSSNATHMDYRRTSQNGVQLIAVEVLMEQVRTTAAAAFTSSKTASGAGNSNTGAVQAVPPTPPQIPPIDASLAGAANRFAGA